MRVFFTSDNSIFIVSFVCLRPIPMFLVSSFPWFTSIPKGLVFFFLSVSGGDQSGVDSRYAGRTVPVLAGCRAVVLAGAVDAVAREGVCAGLHDRRPR